MADIPKRHYIENFPGTVWSILRSLNRKEITEYVDSLPSFSDKIKEAKPLIEGAVDYINENSQQAYKYLYNAAKKHFIVAKSNGKDLDNLITCRSDPCEGNFVRFFKSAADEKDISRVKSIENFLKHYHIKKSF